MTIPRWTGWAISITSVLVIGAAVWQRWYLPDRQMVLVFGALFAAGIVTDVAWKSAEKRTSAAAAVIQPLLFLICALSMFSILFGTWAGLYESYFMTGNIVPFSDAASWVHGAKSLLATGQLTQISSIRPFGICLFAALFVITDHDYQMTLILLTGIVAMAAFFGAREVWHAGGIAAAVFFVALTAFMMAPWLGVFMTELAGFALGCLGFAYLLRGFRRESFGNCLAGIALLSLGLITRPGAVAVIPLLALYILYFFRARARDLLFKAAAVAVVFGMVAGLNSAMVRSVGAEGSLSQGNAYFVLYGIAAGGRSWNYVLEEHPQVFKLSSPGERYQFVKARFWERYSKDRAGFFATILRLTVEGLMSFHLVLFPQYIYIRSIPSVFPAAFAFLAFVFLLLPGRRRGPWGFLAPCAIGILLSFPIIPDEAGLRYYAASYPLAAALAASGVGILAEKLRRRLRGAEAEKTGRSELEGDSSRDRMAWPWAHGVFSGLLVALVSVIPLVLASASGSPSLPKPSKTEDGKFWREVVIYHHPRSGVVIGMEDRIGKVLTASAGSVIRSDGFGSHEALVKKIWLGAYFCEASCTGSLQSPFYLVFNAIPHHRGLKGGYLRATVRSLSESPEWPVLYHVEAFEFFEP